MSTSFIVEENVETKNHYSGNEESRIFIISCHRTSSIDKEVFRLKERFAELLEAYFGIGKVSTKCKEAIFITFYILVLTYDCQTWDYDEER